MAFHRTARIQPASASCRPSRFPGGGSGVAVRFRPGRAAESDGTNRAGSGAYKHSPGIHVMAGRVPAGLQRSATSMEMEATFVQNLRYAADVLAKEGILGLIEPINTRVTDPQYFLDSPHQAAEILQKVDRPNIKLQMDVYHWQIMDGNLTQNIQKYFPLIGHVQVAQVPDRHEPDSPGEVNFPYLFNLLEKLGYQGYVGCEYKPMGSTEAGLDWVRKYWGGKK
ncbi:putative hydroxypyruvate isomerase isoform X2 [Pygocentrus nattereri]|uniref:putative hydroxypyruvate isomerase isoform X2 n=1 Tax=Pygocentrus nattereri TaxID=42514 RepID=UPI00081464C1|nr:putative hydroxypyruvate isomerase isoform X2 [Pygocentrus nattereri]